MEEINQDIPIIQQKSNFELTKNAKGQWQYRIKIYGDTIEEIQKNVELMQKWAEEKYKGVENA